MRNKELLLFSYEDVVPYTHIIIPKTSGWYIGFFGSNDNNSSMYPNSVHINGSDVKIRSLDTNYQNGFDKPYLHTAIRTVEYSPIQSLYLGSAETKQFSKFDGGNYDLGYVEYWNTSERDGVVFTLEDVGRPIRIWLSVDPPLLLTSTWIQRHSNLSRVLRRRRRSLGGSKC